MLISFLNSHPEIRAKGELLARLKGLPYSRILKQHLVPSAVTKAIGFKLFYYHPMDDGHDEVWRDFSGDREIRIIHLKRRNLLRTYLSRVIAEKHNSWSDRGSGPGDSKRHKSVTVSHDDLKLSFEQTERWQNDTARTFSAHRYVEVFYEDLVASTACSFREITGFLDVSEHIPTTKLVKQNPEAASELIANYDELKERFHNTKWERYFDE